MVNAKQKTVCMFPLLSNSLLSMQKAKEAASGPSPEAAAAAAAGSAGSPQDEQSGGEEPQPNVLAAQAVSSGLLGLDAIIAGIKAMVGSRVGVLSVFSVISSIQHLMFTPLHPPTGCR